MLTVWMFLVTIINPAGAVVDVQGIGPYPDWGSCAAERAAVRVELAKGEVKEITPCVPYPLINFPTCVEAVND